MKFFVSDIFYRPTDLSLVKNFQNFLVLKIFRIFEKYHPMVAQLSLFFLYYDSTKVWKTIDHVWLELSSQNVFWWLFWTQQPSDRNDFEKNIFEQSSNFGLQFWLNLA